MLKGSLIFCGESLYVKLRKVETTVLKLKFNPLMPGCNQRSYTLKQICS